jgi:outer membrane protein OmpA-like peptidoglycan-associated protein
MINVAVSRAHRRLRRQRRLLVACVLSATISFVASHVVLARWASTADSLAAAPSMEKPSGTQRDASPGRPTTASEPAGRPSETGSLAVTVDPSRGSVASATFSGGPIYVYFAFDDDELSDPARASLRTVIRALERDPALSVQLDGYADPNGDPDYNLELSERRVAGVRGHLVQNRIDPARIQSVGRGVLIDRTTTDSEKRRVTATLLNRRR